MILQLSEDGEMVSVIIIVIYKTLDFIDTNVIEPFPFFDRRDL